MSGPEWRWNGLSIVTAEWGASRSADEVADALQFLHDAAAASPYPQRPGQSDGLEHPFSRYATDGAHSVWFNAFGDTTPHVGELQVKAFMGPGDTVPVTN